MLENKTSWYNKQISLQEERDARDQIRREQEEAFKESLAADKRKV